MKDTTIIDAIRGYEEYLNAPANAIEVKRLLDTKKIDVNTVDINGNTALMYSSGNPDALNIAKVLLENGANVNFVNPHNGNTILFIANDTLPNDNKLRFDFFKLLFEYGMDCNSFSPVHGKFPLDAICGNFGNSINVIKLFIKNGANIKGQISPVISSLGHPQACQVINLLHKNGANIDEKRSEIGLTPIHLLIRTAELLAETKKGKEKYKDVLKLIKLFLKLEVDINKQDKFLESPLSVCATIATEKNILILKTLLDHNIDITLKNKQGENLTDIIKLNSNLSDKTKIELLHHIENKELQQKEEKLHKLQSQVLTTEFSI